MTSLTIRYQTGKGELKHITLGRIPLSLPQADIGMLCKIFLDSLVVRHKAS